MEKIIIIPDVHGREFWKEIVPYKETPIVFLGDYLDPYFFEGISEEGALINFKEIISFAKENKNIHLLIGNHDCGYMFNKEICDCRTIKNYKEARYLFLENKDLFNFAYQYNNILFSHAGVHKEWLEFLKKKNINLIGNSLVEQLNSIKNLPEDKIIKALSVVSYYRGGIHSFGSCVWSDIREFTNDKESIKELQIVGHTMLDVPFLINNHIICIDYQIPYYLNKNNSLVNLCTNHIYLNNICTL